MKNRIYRHNFKIKFQIFRVSPSDRDAGRPIVVTRQSLQQSKAVFPISAVNSNDPKQNKVSSETGIS